MIHKVFSGYASSSVNSLDRSITQAHLQILQSARRRLVRLTGDVRRSGANYRNPGISVKGSERLFLIFPLVFRLQRLSAGTPWRKHGLKTGCQQTVYTSPLAATAKNATRSKSRKNSGPSSTLSPSTW